MFKHIAILFLLSTSTVLAECTYKPVDFTFESSGQEYYSYIYEPELITADTFICRLVHFVHNKANKFPNNFVITLFSADYSKGLSLRLSNTSKVLMIIEFTRQTSKYYYQAITYPNPLKRLAEILQNKELPKQGNLKLFELKRYKVVEGFTTHENIKKVIGVLHGKESNGFSNYRGS